MTDARKRILKRGLRALVALLATGAGAAIVSPDFREFVADDTIYALIAAVVPPLAQMAGKWARERKTA